MRIETANAIYEDTFDSLVAKPGAVTGSLVYECSCGEKYIHNIKIFSEKDSPSYQYNFTCCCCNKIKVFVRDIHFKE